MTSGKLENAALHTVFQEKHLMCDSDSDPYRNAFSLTFPALFTIKAFMPYPSYIIKLLKYKVSPDGVTKRQQKIIVKINFSKKLADGASCDRKGMFAKEKICFFPSYEGGCSGFIADQLNSLFITTTVTGNAIRW